MICLYVIEALGSPMSNPNKFPKPDPENPKQPHLTARFGGAAAPPADPHGVSPDLFGFAATVSYRDLFGFCGIFCWCYVNHAIFSTLHKFL